MEELDEVCRALASCSEICRAKADNAEDLRVSIHNKETVRRSCVHLVVVEVLEASVKWFSSSSLCYDAKQADRGVLEQRFLRLLFLCFQFIDNFCRHAEDNQTIMSKYVDLCLLFIGRGLHVIQAISAIFQENFKLCNELEEKTIAHIMHHIVSGTNSEFRKPHYLTFFRSVCLVGDVYIHKNLQYIFKQLCQYGPYKCVGGGGLKDADDTAEKEEQGLLLFRGEKGRRIKFQLLADGRGIEILADKVYRMVSAVESAKDEKSSKLTFGSVMEQKSVLLMSYHIELLSLLTIMLEDVNSDLHFQIQTLLPPTKITEDILSDDTLPSVKAHLLKILRLLYLRTDQPISHPILYENLWDLMLFVQQTVRSINLNQFSVMFSPRSSNFSQLFINDWAPFIKDVLLKEDFLEHTNEDNMSCLSLLIDRIVDILNERALDAERSLVLMEIYDIARAKHILCTAVLTDRAKQYTSMVASRRVSVVQAGQASQKQNVNLRDIKDLASELILSVELFAEAFLQAVDPIGRQGVTAENQGDGALLGQDREEMLSLCNFIQNLKESQLNFSSSSSFSEQETFVFQADQAKHMVDLFRQQSRGGGEVVEHELLIALKVRL
eukprot:315333-Hanusia_phi.AAC.2